MPKKDKFFQDYKDYFSAKHNIIKHYFGGWAPISSKFSAKQGGAKYLIYIDGFAGPGQYENGQSRLAARLSRNHRDTPVF